MEEVFRYPEAYIRYLFHFHADRDLFECHEVLEEYWKEHPDKLLGPVWVGFIQLAVGLYHHRRRNFRGARMMLLSGREKLSTHWKQVASLGMDVDRLLRMMAERIDQVEAGEDYTDMNLPVVEEDLITRCHTLCEEEGAKWCALSDMGNVELVERHRRRDRSDVIAARRQAIAEKKAARKSRRSLGD